MTTSKTFILLEMTITPSSFTCLYWFVLRSFVSFGSTPTETRTEVLCICIVERGMDYPRRLTPFFSFNRLIRCLCHVIQVECQLSWQSSSLLLVKRLRVLPPLMTSHFYQTGRFFLHFLVLRSSSLTYTFPCLGFPSAIHFPRFRDLGPLGWPHSMFRSFH